MKSLKQFQAEAKECCKKCGSYEHITTECTKTKKEEVEIEEALSPQDQTKLKNQKRFAQKKLQMDRQKMQLKKAGKLNVNHEEAEVYWSSKALDQLDELNRYGKETGKATGSLNKPKGSPVKKGGTSSPVMRAVRTSIRKETGKPEGQQKKAKGAKSSAGTGKYLAKAKEKKAYASKAKKAGFKNTQDYTNTMARYGGEDNYKKGRGLGS